ncbi:hypothetical protein HID58_084773 [Brassica napus]|uniref:Uncharacterized protein n=4 Tax=Brassica TaxID=3705 RepID=A0A0D3E203_BRAOL|nr:PREDICTED: uncharacterized protein LOC106319079 [Brassica oleracea var. oleracea]XP_013705577.1 uncharacterized protein LOC106409490 [Brassica napus]KAG2278272.1 hypothetical protein Bca52824_060827 [Brassica carinata]VDD28510.1 unnamed protein product [Brassica oleracea]KAH0856512.1 hypothetical protein HID58_084773 [Brassica napus]CAF1716631.1 unnamed protein product [Brassica napus]
MLQFPTLMSQFPSSTKTIPASHLLPIQWPQPQSDEILLAMEEAELEEKCNEIRKMSPSLPVIGKPVVENQQEEDDDEADDDHDADNGEESDGE